MDPRWAPGPASPASERPAQRRRLPPAARELQPSSRGPRPSSPSAAAGPQTGAPDPRNAGPFADSAADAEGGGSDEDVPHCDCCPLCLHILVAPILTPCRHAFCARCFSRWADVSTARANAAGVQPVGVLDAQGAGGAGLGGDRPTGHAPQPAVVCPLCRAAVPAQLPVDEHKATELQSRLPGPYAARRCELAAEAEREAARRQLLRPLYVGNLHSRVEQPRNLGRGGSSNVHEWTFFVRMGSREDERRFISRVVVHLHPTFAPSTVVLREPPFALRRLGWGIFVVRAEVHFKPEWRHPPLLARWLLDFDGGDQVCVELDFSTGAEGQGGQAGQAAHQQQQEEAGRAVPGAAAGVQPGAEPAAVVGGAAAGLPGWSDSEEDSGEGPGGGREGQVEEGGGGSRGAGRGGRQGAGWAAADEGGEEEDGAGEGPAMSPSAAAAAGGGARLWMSPTLTELLTSAVGRARRAAGGAEAGAGAGAEAGGAAGGEQPAGEPAVRQGFRLYAGPTFNVVEEEAPRGRGGGTSSGVPDAAPGAGAGVGRAAGGAAALDRGRGHGGLGEAPEAEDDDGDDSDWVYGAGMSSDYGDFSSGDEGEVRLGGEARGGGYPELSGSPSSGSEGGRRGWGGREVAGRHAGGEGAGGVRGVGGEGGDGAEVEDGGRAGRGEDGLALLLALSGGGLRRAARAGAGGGGWRWEAAEGYAGSGDSSSGISDSSSSTSRSGGGSDGGGEVYGDSSEGEVGARAGVRHGSPDLDWDW